MISSKERPTLQFGTVVSDYVIIRCIGQGGFGDIYLVCSKKSCEAFAMKVESSYIKKTSILHEINIVRSLQGSLHVPRIISIGEDFSKRYFVQELLGPSLSCLRRTFYNGRFTFPTVLSVSKQMLIVIQDIHKKGIIHNDIKPSNFLIRPNSMNFLCLIDYGLSFQYIDPESGEHIKSHNFSGFKGTLKYASPNAHLGFDLTRRDDMYSWFYSMLELFLGNLPWANEKNKIQVMKMKKNIKNGIGFQALPPQIQALYDLIDGIKIFDAPDYQRFIDSIDETAKGLGVVLGKDHDWEDLEPNIVNDISALPFKLVPGKYVIEPYIDGLYRTPDGNIKYCEHDINDNQIVFHPISKTCSIL